MTTQERTIGEIVAQDYRAAAVFKKYKIDFCCNGNRSLQDATEKKGISVEEIERELENLSEIGEENIDVNRWPLDLLADYVEKTHHRYIKEKSPILLQFLNKIMRVHGERHPELYEVYDLFEESVRDLGEHLEKEERILFPFIRKMMEAKQTGTSLETAHFGSVENPVAMMMHEHDQEGERFRKIADLTSDYQYPADACSTYQVAFKMLEEFQDDLHKHIHTENNILFPKSVELEKTFRN